MNKALALLAIAASALMFVAGGTGATRFSSIDLVLPKTKSTYVDTGKKGYTPGDYFLATGPILAGVGGARVGGLAGVWTLLGPTADSAAMTVHLRNGTLFVSGTIRHEAKRSVLRILSGTGAYEGASGTATFRYLGETSAALHLELA